MHSKSLNSRYLIKNLFVLFFIFSAGITSAQQKQFNLESTTPIIPELLVDEYAADTTAHAFYIYEEGFSEIINTHEIFVKTNYQAKIKILDKEGFNEGNISIYAQQYSDYGDEIKNIEAATYNYEDGRLVKTALNENDIHIENERGYNLVKFTFPAMKPGSVLVYSYDKFSRNTYHFDNWFFQTNIPKKVSKFTEKIPGNYEYYTVKIGSHDMETSEPKIVKRCFAVRGAGNMAECLQRTYTMNDIPAFKEEKYLTSRMNFLNRLDYELLQIHQLDGTTTRLTKTWEDVDLEVKGDANLGRQLRRDKLVDDMLPAEIKSNSDKLEKAKEIYHFVQDNYTWNGDYQIYTDMNLKDLIKQKTGNVSALNVMLHNLLDAEGYEVYPVLAATRARGLPSRLHPSMGDYNYLFVMAMIDGKRYLLDATDKQLDFGRLPYRALNGYARKMDFKKGSEWIDIVPTDYSSVYYTDSLKVNADGTSEGISKQILKGYHALNYRNAIKGKSASEIFSSVADPTDHADATDVETVNLNEVEENLEITYTLQNKSQKINDMIYLNPFNFQFFTSNPFVNDRRTYPIDFGYKDAYMYASVIEIPENYSVVDLPEQKAIQMSGGGATLVFSTKQQDEHQINIQCRLSFKQALYGPEYYDAIKRFFNEIMEVQEKSVIVLKENS